MTASATALRVVPSATPQHQPRTVAHAAAFGSTRDVLVATRDRLAVAIDDPKTLARDLAALTKRLMETAREIASIDARDEPDDLETVEDAPFDPRMI